MKNKYLISGVIIAILAIALYFIFVPETSELGGARSGQQTLVDNATSTNLNVAGRIVDVGDYKNCVVTTVIKNAYEMSTTGIADNYTFKFQGSSMDDQPIFTSVATSSAIYASTTALTYATFSSANFWSYIPATNIETGQAITANVGTSTIGDDIVTRFSIDDDNIRWLGIQLTVASTTNSDPFATTTFSAFVNCDNN